MHNKTNAQALKDNADTAWEQGNLQTAIELYKQALELQPDFFQAHANIGSVYAMQKDFSNALLHYKQAIELQPEIAALYSNTADIHNEARQFSEAEYFSREALKYDANYIPAINNLCIALRQQDKTDQAIEILNKTLPLAPGVPELWVNMGDCYSRKKEYQEAVKYFTKATEINPRVAQVYHKLAIATEKMGQYETLIEYLHKSLTLIPTLKQTHSKYLFFLNTRGTMSTADTYKEFLKWDEIQGEHGRANKFTHTKPASAPQKLRIGYVSPDFRQHSVSFFFQPIISNHDKSKFEIYCYANVPKPDEVTARLQKHADKWYDIFDATEQEVAQLIYDDKIDILVDLAGHTGYNQLQAFTYKPAPVQATYLGGATTSGLRDMDYWITDAIIHPDNTQEPSTEEKYRLPRCFYSYKPPENAPDIQTESRATDPTFASFNDYRKLTEQTIMMWSKVLTAVPQAVMLLKHRSLEHEDRQAWIREKFRQHKIDDSRISFGGHTSNHAEHLEQYNSIDVALDPFPFTGATTTIDTMWMGVPTVTLAGDSMASRYSASFLHTVGLDDLVTDNIDDYVKVAAKLIHDNARLKDLRKNLRHTMQHSELCDGVGLTKALEDFYQQAYTQYLSVK